MLEFGIELLFIIVICCCFQYYHGYCHALATSIKLLKRHYQRRPSSHITQIIAELLANHEYIIEYQEHDGEK